MQFRIKSYISSALLGKMCSPTQDLNLKLLAYSADTVPVALLSMPRTITITHVYRFYLIRHSFNLNQNMVKMGNMTYSRNIKYDLYYKIIHFILLNCLTYKDVKYICGTVWCSGKCVRLAILRLLVRHKFKPSQVHLLFP